MSKFRHSKYKSLHQEENITLIKGEARFISNDIVEVVTDEGGMNYTSEHIVINTGAISKIPDIKGIKDASRVYTSTSILEKEELPEHVMMIGGGYIAMEFATMYANFGSKVTIINRDEKILPQEDHAIRDEILKNLYEQGIRIMNNVETNEITEDEYAIAAHLNNGETITGDALLIAAGRRPNTEGLHLMNTSIYLTEHETIKVSGTVQTTVPNIWAVGDVKGQEQFTYVSYDDGRKVIDHIFGNEERLAKPRKSIQFTVFTDPPFSRVGMTEAAAKKAGYRVLSKEIKVRTIGRAHIIRDTRGLFKSVVDADTGLILGASLYGPSSEEVINIIKIAIDCAWHYEDLRDQIFNHPIMSEAINGLFNV